MSLKEEMPEIPKIHDSELREAVKALVSASDCLRKLLIMSLNEEATKMSIMTENADLMLIADKIIERWLLEFTDDDDMPNYFSNN